VPCGRDLAWAEQSETEDVAWVGFASPAELEAARPRPINAANVIKSVTAVLRIA
jgi:hypothetical protein